MKKITFLLIVLLLSFVQYAQTWQQIGPNGGYFKDFAIHPHNDQVVFTGSDDSGGIWKSTDGSDTWELVTEEIPDMTGWHIQFDSSNPNIIYACDVYGRYGIIKSTDGGDNWSVINNGLTSKHDKMVSKIAIDPFDNQTLFISTGLDNTGNPPRPGNGIFKSTNGGNSWVSSGLLDTTVTCIAVTSSGKLFAGTEGEGVFYSDDSGVTWNLVSGIPSNVPIHQIEIKDSVIAVAADVNGIYLSDNNGTTFANIGLSNEFNFDISISTIDPEIRLYSTSTTVLQKYTSSSGSWSTVPGLPNNLLGIGVTSVDDQIYYAVFANTNFWHSSNGGNSFNEITNSPYCTEISSIAVNPNNQDHFFVSLLGTYSENFNKECLFETVDGGNTWARKGPLAHGLCVRFVPGNSSTMFCGTFGNGLYKTTDNFNTYSNIRSGNLVIADISIDVQDTSKVYISELNLNNFSFGLYYSQDGGNNFSLILSQIVHKIYNSPTSDSLFVASENGLYISPDNGVNWINLYAGTNFTSITQYNGTIYAGTSSGQIIKAFPTYQDITGSWGKSVVKTILVKNDTLYLGLSGAEQDTSYTLQGGVWYSSDLGSTWNNMSSGLTTTHSFGNPGLSFLNNKLLSASYSGGVFEYSAPTITAIENIDTYPTQLIIYPNPANKYITFYTPKGFEYERIIIYNQMGKTEKRLSNINLSKETRIKTSDLPPGMYYLVLQNKNKQAIGRFLINK